MIVITCALWVPPQLHGMQRNDARKTLYDYVFKGWMTSINQHLANYFWTRTRMDYLSSISGLMFAAVSRGVLHRSTPSTRRRLDGVTGAPRRSTRGSATSGARRATAT